MKVHNPSIHESESFVSGDFDRLIHAGAYAGLALLVEHLLCYDPEQFKKDPDLVIAGSNILGVTTLAVAYGAAKRSAQAGLEFFAMASVAGVVVIGIRIARRSQRIDRWVNFLAGRITERIEGALDDDQSYARNGASHRRT